LFSKHNTQFTNKANKLSLDFGMGVAGEVDREEIRLAQVSCDHNSVPSSFFLKKIISNNLLKILI